MIKYFSVDKDGVHRAEMKSEEAIIGWFLEQDIQSSQEACREYINALEAVRRGELQEWEVTGNAFTLTAGQLKSTIKSEFSDNTADLTTERLIECLKAWSNHIRRSKP